MIHRWCASVAIATALTACLVGGAWAANGDVTNIAANCTGGTFTGASAADICVDTTDGSYYLIDSYSGEICHYSSAGVVQTTFGHPYGAATFPFFTPVMRGIAYNSATDTLFVLNGTTKEIIEIDKLSGSAVGIDIPLTPVVSNRDVWGLTYDSINNSFWYRDVVNNEVVECDTAGVTLATVSLPQSGEFLFGNGIEYVEVSGNRFLEYTQGTALDCEAERVLRIDTAGALTGEVTDLSNVTATVFGLARGASSTTLYACTEADLVSIDATQAAILPPGLLTCTSDLDGSIQLNWINHGIGVGGAYTAITVLRSNDGGAIFSEIASLAGDAVTYTDAEVIGSDILLDTTLIYRVRAGILTANPHTECSTRSGAGALVSYQKFEGSSLHEFAYDPDTGELYVTDLSGHAIYHFDSNLASLGTLDPGINFPRGIVYDSDADILIVSRIGSTLLSVVDPVTGTLVVEFTTPDAGVEIGSLTYDPFEKDLLYVNLTDLKIVRVEAQNDAGLGLSRGTFISECEIPTTSGLTLEDGITFLESETLLATVSPAALFQLNSDTCFPVAGAGQSIPLEGLGACYSEEDAIRGMVAVNNVAYVGGGLTNTIYKVLLAPTEDAFIRGDVNGDAVLALVDAIYVANYLFVAGSPAPACADAADVNDDARLDISDPLYLILYLFLSAPPPPTPFPASGQDPTFLDGIGC